MSKQSQSPAVHVLKIFPTYFEALKSGAKNFEMRQYTGFIDGSVNRDFKVGDTLQMYSIGCPSETIERTITYILFDTDFKALPKGWCILGLR